jgi:hopanoid C-2 methylase
MIRKRVLIVNCYVDELRLPVARPRKLPQSLAPAFLAGALDPQRCEVRLYSELFSGPLEDEALLSWPDLLVLTGLNTAFDRMRHLTAYVRTKNPRVIVAAGGPAVRALPQLSACTFDYVCTGDVEQLREVVRDAWGGAFTAEEMRPRFELLPPGRIGYIETSRNCQFRCSFCTLSAERQRYLSSTPAQIRDQVRRQGRKDIVVLLDNNFYGPNRTEFHARLETLRELHREGSLGGWAALVTGDFFTPENLRLAREAGCMALFSGVEAFDMEWLRSCRKVQNTRVPQVEMIRNCLDAGILFLYGLMLDVTTRPLADLKAELDFIFSTPEISLPSYLALPIPLLGTPYFHECVAAGRLLPNLRLRDMDSTTLALRPVDPLPEVAAFVRDLQALAGYRWRSVRHTAAFAWRYGRRFDLIQSLSALGNVAGLVTPRLASGALLQSWLSARGPRTHIGGTEPLDALYTPALPVAERFADYFRPTMVTDGAGGLTSEMAELAPASAALRRGEPARPAEMALAVA